VNTASQPISMESIIASTARVPFSLTDMGCIVEHLKKCRRNDLDLYIDGDTSNESLAEMMKNACSCFSRVSC